MASEATQSGKSDNHWTLPDAFAVMLSIVCLLLALNIGLLLLNFRAIFETSPYRSLITLALFLVQEVIFIVPLYFIIIKKNAVSLAQLGLRKIKLFAGAKWVLKGFGFVVIFNMLLTLFTLRVGHFLPGFGPQESHVPLFGGSVLDIVIAVFALVIIAPIIEEIVFRGFILQTTVNRLGTAWGSIIAAGIFAAVHFEFGSAGIIFILGLVLNWIFIRSRSLWPCVAFHVINNGLAFLLEWLVWSGRFPV